MNDLKNEKVKNRVYDDRSSKFSKNFFHVFNFIFLLAGCGVVGVGLWTVLHKREFVLLTNLPYPACPTAYMLIVAGFLTLVASFVGCYSVRKHNRCTLLLYMFLLLFIFLMEAMVGLLSFIYMNQVTQPNGDFHRNLNKTFVDNYGLSLVETDAIDRMQQEYKCCGASGFDNYENSWWRRRSNTTNLVPDSCCKSVSPGCGKSNSPSNISYTGCVHKLSDVVRQLLSLVCGTGLGFSVIQIFGMILSCCLYVKLKSQLLPLPPNQRGHFQHLRTTANVSMRRIAYSITDKYLPTLSTSSAGKSATLAIVQYSSLPKKPVEMVHGGSSQLAPKYEMTGRSAEARKSGFEALQSKPKVKTAPPQAASSAGGWGPTFKNKSHFASLHHC